MRPIHGDMHLIDPRFKSTWDGPVQDIFDRIPTVRMVSELRPFIVYDGEAMPPVSNPPYSQAQHSITPPQNPDRLVAEYEDFMSHVREATEASMPFKQQSAVESPDLIAAVTFLATHITDPAFVIKRRKMILNKLESFAAELKPFDTMLEAIMPPTVVALRAKVPVNICLMYVLNKLVRSPDTYLPHCFVTGFPMEGYLQRTGWYREGCYEQTNFEEDFHDWNVHLIRSIRKRAMKHPSPDLEECYKATMKEVELGFMTGPFTYDEVCAELHPKNINAIRRFPQYRYPGAPVRPCDNGAENEENDRFTSYDKLVTENSDFPLRVLRLYHEVLGYVPKFRLGSNDLKKAYRQMPSGHPERTVVALWNPHTKRVEFFIVLGMPFGLATAVLQFNRPMELMQSVLRRLLAVPCAHYYDDWVTPSPACMAKSDDKTVRRTHWIIRFLLDADKWFPPDPTNDFTGVRYDFSHAPSGVVTIRIKPDRKVKLLTLVADIVESGSCSSGTASTLRGKLFFASTQAFGRVGRAPLQALVDRQYSRDTEITDRMLECLSFADHFLRHADASPRTILLSPDPRPHLIIWTDASWERGGGMIGAVVYDSATSKFTYSSAAIPQWLIDTWETLNPGHQQKIGQAEIFAEIVVYPSLPAEMIRGRRVLHFVDNTSALYAVYNGYSRAADSSWMVNMFHCMNATIRADIWWEYVASKANIADLPSRNQFDVLVNELNAEFFELNLEQAFWMQPPQSFLPIES